MSPILFSSRFYIFFQNSASVAGFRRKGLKLQYDIGTTMHPPLLPISQTSIFSTFKKTQTLDGERVGGSKHWRMPGRKLNCHNFCHKSCPPSLSRRVGNEQDGNARPFNFQTFFVLFFINSLHPDLTELRAGWTARGEYVGWIVNHCRNYFTQNG